MNTFERSFILWQIIFLVGCQTKKIADSAISQDNKYAFEKHDKRSAFFMVELDSTHLVMEKRIITSVYDYLPQQNEINFVRYITNNKVPALANKKKINVSFSMDNAYAPQPKEYVRFFLDNTLWFSDSCLSREAFESNYYAKNLKKQVIHVLNNNNKKDNVKLSILLCESKIYCDTVIPLKFKDINIHYTSGEFHLRFSKMVN